MKTSSRKPEQCTCSTGKEVTSLFKYCEQHMGNPKSLTSQDDWERRFAQIMLKFIQANWKAMSEEQPYTRMTYDRIAHEVEQELKKWIEQEKAASYQLGYTESVSHQLEEAYEEGHNKGVRETVEKIEYYVRDAKMSWNYNSKAGIVLKDILTFLDSLSQESKKEGLK